MPFLPFSALLSKPAKPSSSPTTITTLPSIAPDPVFTASSPSPILLPAPISGETHRRARHGHNVSFDAHVDGHIKHKSHAYPPLPTFTIDEARTNSPITARGPAHFLRTYHTIYSDNGVPVLQDTMYASIMEVLLPDPRPVTFTTDLGAPFPDDSDSSYFMTDFTLPPPSPATDLIESPLTASPSTPLPANPPPSPARKSTLPPSVSLADLLDAAEEVRALQASVSFLVASASKDSCGTWSTGGRGFGRERVGSV